MCVYVQEHVYRNMCGGPQTTLAVIPHVASALFSETLSIGPGLTK